MGACVSEAINPCLEGNNGGCDPDADCIHTGPNKVQAKFKHTPDKKVVSNKRISFKFTI